MVTGASSGIGAKFAKELAVKGLNVVLVARREEKLEVLAKDIVSQHAVKTQVIVADLSDDSGIKAVKDETHNLEIGLLINNAGVEDSGHLLESSIDKAVATLELNCRLLLYLHITLQRK